jgi:hypothetical protein
VAGKQSARGLAERTGPMTSKRPPPQPILDAPSGSSVLVRPETPSETAGASNTEVAEPSANLQKVVVSAGAADEAPLATNHAVKFLLDLPIFNCRLYVS